MSEIKFTPFQRVLVRDFESNTWQPALFGYHENSAHPYRTLNGVRWIHCIPYEGNEHLLGTTDSPTPPEPEFMWGEKVEAKDEMQEPYEPAIYLGPITDHPKLRHRVIYKGEIISCCVERCRHADW